MQSIVLPPLIHRTEALSRLMPAQNFVAAPLRIPKRRDSIERCVLVIDDDPDIPALVEAALAPYEIRTEAVYSGRAALERMEANAYDLIILDLGLEGMNGFDVLRALKKGPRHRWVPVLILTSDDTNEALARSFGYGADDLVTKPFNRHELGMRVYRLVHPFHTP